MCHLGCVTRDLQESTKERSGLCWFINPEGSCPSWRGRQGTGTLLTSACMGSPEQRTGPRAMLYNHKISPQGPTSFNKTSPPKHLQPLKQLHKQSVQTHKLGTVHIHATLNVACAKFVGVKDDSVEGHAQCQMLVFLETDLLAVPVWFTVL